MSLRLMWLGTYERGYPRTSVLVSGLRELGVEVVECHRPLWERTRHKAGGFLSPRRAPVTAARFAWAWAALLAEQRRVEPVDAVVAGYPAQPDVALARRCARARGVPLVVDLMISLADTLLGDRERVGAAAGTALERLDRYSVRHADVLIADTATHVEFWVERFGAVRERTGIVPVGSVPGLFPPAPQPNGDVRAAFWGKPSPMHGLETVLEAARMPGAPPLRLIGDGQLGPWLDAELARRPPPGLERVRWVPHEEMAGEIAAASISLGIFGTTEKAQRVVPNKVWEAMSVGRPIVTADTPGIREVLTDSENALLVPPGDPEGLAAALRRLAGDAALRARLGESARRRYEEVGSPPAVARRFLEVLARNGLRG
ncbi:MAG: glycosyltransferase [Solirubrobacterales bacterium]